MSEPNATITDTPESANQSANRDAAGDAAPRPNLREAPDQGESFWHRTLRGARRVWSDWAGSLEADLVGPTLSEADAEILLRHMRDCVAGEGGEVSARARAARLGEIYWGLERAGRRRFLTLIVENFGPDEAAIDRAIDAYRAAVAADTHGDRTGRVGDLRAALESPWIELLTQFNALPQGVKFLVDMRADIRGFLKEEPSLAPLDRDMQRLLASWFDIGFLTLTRITWESPAALLEKLIEYEAVHEIRSWTDLRNRLDSDRRLFAFFHPRMPMEPLIFVEVALVKGIAGSVQALLDEDAPVLAPDAADTAIFYSISNSQAGLKGVSFGNFLIKRVVEELKTESPNLRAFATLSPIPGFKRWLDHAIAEGLSGIMSASDRRLLKSALGDGFKKGDLPGLLAAPDWRLTSETADALRPMLMRLCARYLLQEKRGAEPLDPVARFHLNNGAQLDRINWLGDVSDKGMRESAGMMVNYLYKLSEIERNHERYAKNAFITASSQVKDLL